MLPIAVCLNLNLPVLFVVKSSPSRINVAPLSMSLLAISSTASKRFHDSISAFTAMTRSLQSSLTIHCLKNLLCPASSRVIICCALELRMDLQDRENCHYDGLSLRPFVFMKRWQIPWCRLLLAGYLQLHCEAQQLRWILGGIFFLGSLWQVQTFAQNIFPEKLFYT